MTTQVGRLFDDFFDAHEPGKTPPMNPLRLANGGVNAPLCAQYVHLLLRELPREIASRPRSAEFRNAARALMARQPFYLEATRVDIEAGLHWLARNGFLPRWVMWGEGREDAHSR